MNDLGMAQFLGGMVIVLWGLVVAGLIADTVLIARIIQWMSLRKKRW